MATQCRLCLQDHILRDSHIIPEFLYRPGYDEKGRMEALRLGTLKTKYIQKGFRQKLLCDDCENLLANRYEDYFARLWYLNNSLPASATEKFLRLQGLNYNLFKLFHLSILWRASISSLPPFAEVSLGVDEERIRTMLLAEDPGEPSDFQIVGVVLLLPNTADVLDGFIAAPTKRAYGELPLYMFVFGGCAWHYVVANQPIQAFSSIALSPDGSITLPVYDLQKVKPLDSFFREYVRGRAS
jgi:hypothetical protein